MKMAEMILVLLAAILLTSAGSASDRAFDGIWAGSVELPERAVDEIVLVVDESEFGVSGTISDGLEILRPETSFAGIRPDGNTLVFSFPTADGLTLVAALRAHGGRLIGVWTDPDGRSGKIELDRRYAPVSENPR